MLEVKDLVTRYGPIEAVKGVSFEVKKGEIVSILGANGAGKTTTLKSVVGLVKARSGKVILDGEDISGMSAHKIVSKGISLVPEGRMVIPHFTVMENLKVGAYLQKDKNKVQQALEENLETFPILKERLSQRAGTLSGGEQQMLAIARGLMIQPKVLMLDEPSLGLAPIIVEQIFEIVKRVNERGITILMVEQNVFGALEIVHRGYVLETGKISLSGTAGELLENPEIKNHYLGAEVS